MSPTIATIEIDRPPEIVFSYATDPRTFPDWQAGVISGRLDASPAGVGSRCTTTRKIGGAAREVISEITEFSPPLRWSDRGIAGPIRGLVKLTIEPLDEQSRSRVTIELDFEGRGIGKLLVPLFVRRQAEREMPINMRNLKRELEQPS